jgi:O-acetyl-ADP-ribose deacetylase (regulator of RNase III)
MIKPSKGNLLLADADILVNTVNTHGVMGKGIALQFRNAYPDVYKSYAAACAEGAVRLGQMDVHDLGSIAGGPRWIVNFPTKGHWRSKSKLSDIRAGLEDLVRVVQRLGAKSVAVPPLGCGNGGLHWSDVRPMIEKAFSALPEVDVLLYPPGNVPDAVDMPIRTEKKKLSLSSSVLILLMHRYLRGLLDPFVSLLEVQKLMYLMQVSGFDLKLNYEKGTYGPYASKLGHMLKRLEGHHLMGYGDGSDDPKKPMTVLDEAVDEAESVLARRDDAAKHIDRVAKLIEGYEDAVGMELLTTVLWVMDHHEETRDSPSSTVEYVHAWSERKKSMKAEHIEKAWLRIIERGWHHSELHVVH